MSKSAAADVTDHMGLVRDATQRRLDEIDSELTAISKAREASGRGSDEEEDEDVDIKGGTPVGVDGAYKKQPFFPIVCRSSMCIA